MKKKPSGVKLKQVDRDEYKFPGHIGIYFARKFT